MYLSLSRRKFVLAFAGVALAIGSLAFAVNRTGLGYKWIVKSNPSSVVMPRVVLWAWERPSDLSFINPDEVGVAFLAQSIKLSGERVVVRPRLQPLNVPAGTGLTAVARIETDRTDAPALSEAQLQSLISELRKMAGTQGISAIQIDFDATQSERPFYHRLITELRRQLPPGTTLSITALASWCVGDKWLSDLPLDEAVPMLFRMGADAGQMQSRLETGKDFPEARCRGSYGISTDEPLNGLRHDRRLYVFSPHGWTMESLHALIERAKHE